MATHKPYTEISTLPANANGDVTILEAHLDAAHSTITDVIEYLAQAVWSAGGVVIPGTVTNPSGALVRVEGRLGVTLDAKTLVAVGDQSVDLAGVATGTKCLVVIQAKAGASTSHNFVDASTGESITHSLLRAWGKLEVIEGDASNYPPLPAGSVPVAEVTKSGASALTLDSVITAAPTARVGGSGGTSFYDLQLGFMGVPDAGAVDVVLSARAVTIDDADPGEVYVGTHPTSAATIAIQKNGSAVGSIDITTGGVASWTVGADIVLTKGDRLSLVAPSPADATLAGVLVAFRGTAA